VLDVGCGPGRLGGRVAEHCGAEVVGVDTSVRMVELARERGLAAIVGDAQSLPFADREFDCVLAAWMLYHVPSLDRAVLELARVLRPGGLLVATTNGEGHLSELWTRIGPAWTTLPFRRENGARILHRAFSHVEQVDFTTRARFPDREAVVRYAASLADTPDVPADIAPFDAHGEPTVFLARA
jgi:ubiquinone/menaquinone biosynthesis C-methylase UbiE